MAKFKHNPKSDDKKVIVGAVEFISKTQAANKGFFDDYPDNIVLLYEDNVGNLFWKRGFSNDYYHVFEYLIKERYTIEEAQKKFPYLFL